MVRAAEELPMPLVRFATLLLAAVSALPSLPQTAPEVFGLPAGEHSVGFRLLEDHDASRIVSAGARGAVHPRPIRTYLWYPAETARAQPMRFGRYAALADDDVWPDEITGDLRRRLKFENGPLARSLSKTSYAALLARPTRGVENAAPLAGPFPLIVIGLGLYYESPVTFATTAEYLAGRGFVVATAPLVGTHTTPVRLVVEDLETQVRDLEFVIARARQFSFVDAERLGVLGFDQGGMAGAVLAMRNRDVDAFVSLDSGIQYPHASGLPRSSPHYDALALRVPWLHAASRADGPQRTDGARSLFDEAVHSERYWLRIQDLGHADFTSYALVEGRGDVAGAWNAATPAGAAGHRAVAEYVLHFFGAYLARSDVSMALLDQAREALPPDAGMTLEQRPATPAPISYDEVVRKIVSGQAEEAVSGLRALVAQSPDDPMLSEFNLGRLCVSLLITWNLAKETVPLAEFAVERYPSSPNAKAMLAAARERAAQSD
jgi:dienelactone hydrolase